MYLALIYFFYLGTPHIHLGILFDKLILYYTFPFFYALYLTFEDNLIRRTIYIRIVQFFQIFNYKKNCWKIFFRKKYL